MQYLNNITNKNPEWNNNFTYFFYTYTFLLFTSKFRLTKQFDLSSEEDYRSQLKEKAKELLEQRFEESQGHSTTLEKENKAKPLESSEFTSHLNNEVEIEMEV